MQHYRCWHFWVLFEHILFSKKSIVILFRLDIQIHPHPHPPPHPPKKKKNEKAFEPSLNLVVILFKTGSPKMNILELKAWSPDESRQ